MCYNQIYMDVAKFRICILVHACLRMCVGMYVFHFLFLMNRQVCFTFNKLYSGVSSLA